jgi:membrane protein implicated in regulation of membrane protease activity
MDWIREHLWETWLALAAVLVVVELFSLELILLMVAVGALAGMTADLAGLPFAAQGAIAAGTSLAALTLARPSMVKRLRQGPELQQGHQRLVGTRGAVRREISVDHPGLASFGGDEWTCVPYDETLVIPVGASVEVWDIRGAMAVVHPTHGTLELGES